MVRSVKSQFDTKKRSKITKLMQFWLSQPERVQSTTGKQSSQGLDPRHNYNYSLSPMRFEEDCESKRKYSRISYKKREILVKMVLEDEQSIACAARRLGLKASTARMIINKYKKTKTFPMKNFRKPLKGVCAQQALAGAPPSMQNVKTQPEESPEMKEPSFEQPQHEPTVSRPFDPWLHYMMTVNPYQALYYPLGLPFH